MKYMKRRGLKLFAVAALLPVMAAASNINPGTSSAAPVAVNMTAEDQETAKQVEHLVRQFLADVP